MRWPRRTTPRDATPDTGRLDQIRARLAAATPGRLEIKGHDHPEAGCRCLSCDVSTGHRLDHPSWPTCDETPEMQRAHEAARRSGKHQEDCYIAPMPYADADLAAHAHEDISWLLERLGDPKGDRP